jgi:NADPH:quinone reductase-like Zn-dependent oxidoreductase
MNTTLVVRTLAPAGVTRGHGPVRHRDGRDRTGARRTARADLHDRRGPNPPAGVRATGGSHPEPDALDRITDAILAGKLTVPVAATFSIEQIRDAVTLQAGRHPHGKILVTL